MAEAVYVLCTVLSMGCAFLLVRAYGDSRLPLLLWSGLCFIALGLNNIFLLMDLVFEPELDFSIWRNFTGLVGCCFLLYGLLWTKVPLAPAKRRR